MQLSPAQGPRRRARAKEQIDDLLKRVDELKATPEKMDAEEHRV